MEKISAKDFSNKCNDCQNAIKEILKKYKVYWLDVYIDYNSEKYKVDIKYNWGAIGSVPREEALSFAKAIKEIDNMILNYWTPIELNGPIDLIREN